MKILITIYISLVNPIKLKIIQEIIINNLIRNIILLLYNKVVCVVSISEFVGQIYT